MRDDLNAYIDGTKHKKWQGRHKMAAETEIQVQDSCNIRKAINSLMQKSKAEMVHQKGKSIRMSTSKLLRVNHHSAARHLRVTTSYHGEWYRQNQGTRIDIHVVTKAVFFYSPYRDTSSRGLRRGWCRGKISDIHWCTSQQIVSGEIKLFQLEKKRIKDNIDRLTELLSG
jgi:hypothetical protein